jgi:hypothetical protein
MLDHVIDDPALQLQRYDFEQEDGDGQRDQTQLVPTARFQNITVYVPRHCGSEPGGCGSAKHASAVGGGLDYATHDHTIATTVTAIVAVASQPMIRSPSGSVNPAMIERRIVRHISVTITGTATTPFRWRCRWDRRPPRR